MNKFLKKTAKELLQEGWIILKEPENADRISVCYEETASFGPMYRVDVLTDLEFPCDEDLSSCEHLIEENLDAYIKSIYK